MADLRLSGKNIGVLKEFDMKLGKLTLLSGECGSGKTTILRTLCYLTEAGMRIDQCVFDTLLSFYMELSDKVEDRVKASDLPDERRKEISGILWEEGIEPHMDEFLKEGLITEEEFKEHVDIISHDYFRWEDGDDRFLSDLVADEIEDTVDIEFPYIAEGGNRGEIEMRLEGIEAEGQPEDKAEVILDEECNLKSCSVPIAPETVYISNVPIVDGYSVDDEGDEMEWRTLEERGWWKVVEADYEDEEYTDDEETEAHEDFQDKLETALERFLMDTVRGSFEYDEEDDAFTFYREEDGEGFDLECMPSSFKAVADLALLIRRRAIHEDTILVVDGLEQTLSPQWKTCLAEFLVGLSRLADVRVVVSSMSSEFIEAITYFADEYLDDDQFRCYMTEYDEEWKSSVIEVTDDFEPLDEFLNGPEPDDWEEDGEVEDWEEDGEDEEVDDYFDPDNE